MVKVRGQGRIGSDETTRQILSVYCLLRLTRSSVNPEAVVRIPRHVHTRFMITQARFKRAVAARAPWRLARNSPKRVVHAVEETEGSVRTSACENRKTDPICYAIPVEVVPLRLT